jgi:hypothetical protein
LALSSIADSQVSLELSEVTTFSNSIAGTNLQSSNGGILTAFITRQKADGDGTGLFASGSGTQLDLTDSVFCSSTNVDVRLFDNPSGSFPMGTFSRNTCDTTSGNLALSTICEFRCNFN